MAHVAKSVELLGRFSERPFMWIEFVTCDTIRAAIHRAFASWSDNSAYVHFLDVTEQCKRLGQLSSDCPLAEIWVTWLDPATGEAATSASGGRRLKGVLPAADGARGP